MKFIIGAEDGWGWLERLTYKGAIGIFYNDTWSGVLAYAIFALVALFAVIGFFSVLKFIFFRKKDKMTPGQKWMKTGKF
jgi:hypothetical protein